MTQRFTRRAVSPVISAVLLVGVAVTASILVCVYSTGVVFPLMGPPPNAVDLPLIEMIACSSDSSAQLTVRNIGAGDLSVASIYVDGNLAYSAPQGIWIPVGQAWTFVIPNVAPTQHMFKVVTLNGGMVSTYGPYFIYCVGYTTTYVTQYTTTSTGSGLMTTTATATTTSYIISTGGKTTITITTTSCGPCGGSITTRITTTITTPISTTTITQTSTITSTGNSTITSTGTTTVTTDTT